MKNKLFLEEGEISRILNMHKKAIREELNVNGDEVENNEVQMDEELSEDAQVSKTLAGAGTGAAIGAGVGVWFFGAAAGPGAVIGALVGGAVGYIGSLMNSYSLEGAKKILEACSTTKKADMGKPTMSREYLTKIADDMNYGVEGAGTYENTVASAIKQTKYIPNLCAMAAIYKQRQGESLFDAIDNDIDLPSEWKTYVFLPLLDVYNNSVDLGKKMLKQQQQNQQQQKTGGGGAPKTGEVYLKCLSIIDGMTKDYGYTYVTLDVFNQSPTDKYEKVSKPCTAAKTNVYFIKALPGGGGSGKNPGDDGPPIYTGGGGGGGRKTYTFDVAEVNKLIDAKCSKDGKPGGTGVNLDANGTPTPTPIPNMPKDMVDEF